MELRRKDLDPERRLVDHFELAIARTPQSARPATELLIRLTRGLENRH